MFLLLHLIYCNNYNYDSKGCYSINALPGDVIQIRPPNDARVFLFTSSDIKNCFILFDSVTEFPEDLVKSTSSDSSINNILVLKNVNISMWIIDQNICHRHSLFVISEFQYMLKITTNFTNQGESFCLFSPSHLRSAVRQIHAIQTDQKSDSTIEIYSMNPDQPDYDNKKGELDITTSFPYFIRITAPDPSSSFQIESVFKDSSIRDLSFGDDLVDFSFYYNDTQFFYDSTWISDISVTFTDNPKNPFPWVWAIIIILTLIILILVILFAFCMRYRNSQLNRNGSSCSEDPDSCVPDAQQINQELDASANDNGFVQYPDDNEKMTSDNDNIENNQEEKNDVVKVDKRNDNPYSHDPLSFNESDTQNVDEEINPYSLPKA